MNHQCPRCQTNPAIHDKQFGLLPCVSCQKKDSKLPDAPEFYSLTKQERITKDRADNARDMLQPWIGGKINPEFVKAFPRHAKEYFTKEELKQVK